VELDELRMPANWYTLFGAGPQPSEDPVRVLEGLYGTDNTSSSCSDCVFQTDNTKALQIYIPSEWTDVDGRGWPSLDDSGSMGPGLSASPNLARYYDSWDVPAVQFFATHVNATFWDYLDQHWDYSNRCQREGRHNYDIRSYSGQSYSGHYDVWENCDGRDGALVNLVAWPNDQADPPYMVFVSVRLTGETDIEAAKAVFDSWYVDSDLLSQSAAPETTGPAALETTGITAPNNVGGSNQERTSIDGPSTADLEAEAEEAARDYYRAAGSEDWNYTYNHLDAETRSRFTREEWFKKNQWLSDNYPAVYHILSVDLAEASQEPLTGVKVRLTGEDGSSTIRKTYFVYEDGLWKHRFGQEEYDRLMPSASYEEFVAANR
jgi:hypothetical protein